jgi:Raf kinase inhibitor-like YbhB/YbcL family protein
MDVIHSAKTLIGHALRPFHAGGEKLASNDQQISRAGGIEAFLDVESLDFEADGPIPRTYSAEGQNISPPIRWSDIPAGAKELVLICEDPDAPKAAPYIHWVLYGLSALQTSLPEGVPTTESVAMLGGFRQGRNSAGTIGYTGPMPPIGHGVHHYHFQLFALSEPTGLSNDPGRDELINAMSGHVLALGDLIGTYERE